MYFRKLCLLVILSALVPSTLAQTSIAVEYLLTPVAELGEVYACVVNDVNYSEVGESIVITGDHTEGRSNSAVQALLFQSGVLIGIPNQFFSVYQNLQKLTVSSMGLRSISQETFIGASNLRHVEITGNPITGLTAQTFSRSNRIETVDLSNNQIFNVANNTFAGLLFLRKINLANNHISSIDSTLNTLFNLAELDLSGNNLAIVSPLAFGGMISLKTLRLTDNSFFYIHPDSFSMMYSLETLVLDNNLIQTVEAVLFGRNYALIHLSLKNTKINAIQSTFLENLVQISYLDLSENSCVNEVITVDREKLEEVYAILARCFENFDFDPNLTSTDEPPSISTDSSEVPSTGVIETTTSHARTNISAIFNLSVIVFTGVFSRLHFFN